MEVGSFLGLTGYVDLLRDFHLFLPFDTFDIENIWFTWTDENESAFQELKHR